MLSLAIVLNANPSIQCPDFDPELLVEVLHPAAAVLQALPHLHFEIVLSACDALKGLVHVWMEVFWLVDGVGHFVWAQVQVRFVAVSIVAFAPEK